MPIFVTRRSIPTLIFLLTSGTLLALTYRPTLPAPIFAVSTSRLPYALPVAPTEHRLIAPQQTSHSATLAQLPNGDLVAFWYAGSREGARDVQIWQAHKAANGSWSEPRAVISPQQASVNLYRFINKLGNPVAIVDGRGRLHLVFVSVSMGGWATSHLNQMVSSDGGQTWGAAKPLVVSPFFDMSTLVRAPPIPLAGGGRLLPVYHELLHEFSEILYFDADGRFRYKLRMNSAGDNLQPAIVALDANNGLALLRNAGPSKRILAQRTVDGGAHWSALEPLNLNNPDSSLALTRFGGSLLLAYNPLSTGRSELALALSEDGRHWRKMKIIAKSVTGEYSYPTLLVSGNTAHLVYTWNRREIRYVSFNYQWLTTRTSP